MSTLTRRAWLRSAALAPAAVVAFPHISLAAPSAADLKAVIDKAVKFLASRQKDDGDLSPTPRAGPGITALAVSALARNGYGPDTPVVAKGLAFLEKSVKPDGGVYSQGLATYTTSLAIMAFKDANAGGKYDKVIAAATEFVKGLQYGEKQKVDAKDVRYGGAGYGNPKGDRPDLSNTHFMVEALLAAGVSKDDPAIKNAVAFISKCQNLKSEFNDQPFAEKATEDDNGGLTYTPLDQGGKGPRVTPAGGLRSEGGMTYAGLKSFLYAGVGKDDKRVQAAVAWIRKHYTLDENPGQKNQGLFYYYVTFAKAMEALGEDPFVDAKGVKHDWRQELFDVLKKKQAADGSWVNPGDRFMEDAPELATSFAVLALSYTKKK